MGRVRAERMEGSALNHRLGLPWYLYLELGLCLAGRCMVTCLRAPVALDHAALLCQGLRWVAGLHAWYREPFLLIAPSPNPGNSLESNLT